MSFTAKKILQIKEIAPEQSMDEAHFFNSPEFLLTKPFKIKGWQLVKEKPIGQIYFYINKNIATSGHQSTFGSFDIDEHVTEDELFAITNTVVDELRRKEVTEIVIRQYPSYFNQSTLVDLVLKKIGFVKKTIEINQHIEVTEKPFASLVKRNVKKKINQCEDSKFTFSIESIKNLKAIYELVLDTRTRKNYTISMSLPELNLVVNACSGNFLLFALRDKGTLIAASVSIIVSTNTIYNFYHADAFAYRTKSPLTLLVQYIYEYCQINGYQYLDLGISTMQGELNAGLYKFKQNLGARTTDKVTFSLTV